MRITTYVHAATSALALMTGAWAAEAPNYEEHILPILRESCGQCHRADKTSAGLDVTSLSALEKGGDSGPAVAAGVPENSPLYRAMAHIGSESPMPPDSPKIATAKIELVAAWIKGA
jgi:mono/diheme cytochrome c family protein